MFGKLMSIPDALIVRYFTLLTDLSTEEISALQASMASGANPRDVKARLAVSVVEGYHGPQAAQAAEAGFKAVFSKGGLPDEMPEVSLSWAERPLRLLDLMTRTGHVKSKGEARRLVAQNSVSLYPQGRIEEETALSDEHAAMTPEDGDVLRIGKRGFYRLRL